MHRCLARDPARGTAEPASRRSLAAGFMSPAYTRPRRPEEAVHPVMAQKGLLIARQDVRFL
jgi:hypothetical protein